MTLRMLNFIYVSSALQFGIETDAEVNHTSYVVRKSSNKLLNGLSNILLHLQGWEYHQFVEFFCMDLQDAQKPLLLKLQLMLLKLPFFP